MKQKLKKILPKKVEKKGNIDDPCAEKIIDCLNFIWGNSFTHKFDMCNKKKKKEIIQSMENFFEEKRSEIFQKMDMNKKDLKKLENEEEKNKDKIKHFCSLSDSIIDENEIFINNINDFNEEEKKENEKKGEQSTLVLRKAEKKWKKIFSLLFILLNSLKLKITITIFI